MKFKNTLIIGLATLTLISCNDFLDVDSPSSYNEDFVFSQETEISRALNGVYASILVPDRRLEFMEFGQTCRRKRPCKARIRNHEHLVHVSRNNR